VPELRTLLLWVHIGGVVVWFGAIAYFLLVLRPAVAASGMERGQWYLLLRAVKRRLRRVVGVAVAAVVLSGLLLADLRGLLDWRVVSGGGYGSLVAMKLGLAAALVAVFLTALPLIGRIAQPVRRGRAFVWTHTGALVLGAAAVYVGILLRG
jgi:uncharacterized membrane protein